MRPRLSPLAVVLALGALVACGGSRELEPPAPPPTVPSELLHTLKSPVTTILSGDPAPPSPDGTGTLPLPVPLPTEEPTLAPPASPDGTAPGAEAVEEPSP